MWRNKVNSYENSKEAIEAELAKIGIVPTTREKALQNPLFSKVIRPLDQRKPKR